MTVCRTKWPWRLGVALAVAVLPALLLAAERVDPSQAASETVEMFAAIEDGRIDVTLIPKDSKESRVLIKNKTDKPLTVKMPEAFAGMPVLAQGGFGGVGGIGGVGVGGGRRGGGWSGGGGQAFGGGWGGGGGGWGGGMGGWGGGMGRGGMGGFFNVPPEKIVKTTVTTVCLEHGKREPRAAMKYEIKPIEAFTDKVEVHQLCRMLGNKMMPQRVAQAAAWHLSNDMSWPELAAKQLRFANGIRSPYFSRQEIQAGMQVAAMAKQLAEQSQGDTLEDSLSQR